MASNREERFLMRQRGAGTSRDLRDSGFAIAIPGESDTPQAQPSRGTPRSRPQSKQTPQFQPRNSLGASAGLGARIAASTPAESSKIATEPANLGSVGASGRRRKRKSVGQASLFAKRRRSEEQAIDPAVMAEVEEVEDEIEDVAANNSPPQEDGSREDVEDELESPPVPAQRRVSAKAKGKQPLRPTPGNASRRAPQTSDSEDALAAPASRRIAARRATRTSLPAVHEEADELEVSEAASEAPEQENAPARRSTAAPTKRNSAKRRRQPDPEEPDPAPTKRSKRASLATQSPASRPTPKSKTSTKRRRTAHRASSPDLTAPPTATKPGTIPVTVQRMSNVRSLTFVPAADELAGPTPLLKHPGVNAIDVLAQICREIVTKAETSLAESARATGGPNRAVHKRRAAAVRAFGQELEARLLQMTTSLDHHRGLTQHARALGRAKAAALAELLEVREQRAALALRMDAVRAAHEADGRAARGESELERVLADARLAAQRGRDAQRAALEDGGDAGEEVGLELRARNVADRVSGAAGRVGLLERVRRFNAFLEQVVEVL